MIRRRKKGEIRKLEGKERKGRMFDVIESVGFT